VDIETGRNLGPNERGELCFKGPQIMKGYSGDPQATRASFDSDGFLHTGDVGYYDEDGFFYIVDRVKELIKYKGYQVGSIIYSQKNSNKNIFTSL
jgi:long-subunit acyl-CoA synthetase (AMP-forming)